MTTLSIPEADFWSEPRRTQLDVADRLLDDGFRGLLVDAPRTVDLKQRGELPLVIARAATHAERRGPPFEAHAVLVAVRLPSNQVLVGRAFKPKEARPGPPPPSGPAPKGASVVLYDLDVRERLPGLPWRPGEVLTRVLYRDLASNCARTTLGAPAPADPAVAAFVAAQPVAFPQPVWPPAGARWSRAEGDPALPAGPGIELAVDRSVVIPARGEARCELRLAARVPWRPRYAVRPKPPEGPKPPAPDDGGEAFELDEPTERALRGAEARAAEARALGLVWQDPADPKATAVVPLMVVAVRADAGGTITFPLQVPVHAPLDPDAPPETVELHAAVDLLELPYGLRLAGGTTFIYAFTDGLMAGPVPTAVLREQDLKP